MARKTKSMSGSKPKRFEDTRSYPALGRALMFVDDKRNVKRIVYTLYALCAGLFLADFLYKKKAYVEIEHFPGFYALYGFFMCAALVICAKAMRMVIKQPEDFYAPHDIEAEEFPEDQLDKESHNA